MTSPIKFVDFLKEYTSIKKEIDTAIRKVLEGGTFILGPQVTAFEKELGKFIGVKYSLGVASGTDALTIALKSLKLGFGDQVIVPANVYPTVFGVARSGVTIKLCDVDPKTLNIDPVKIREALTKKTKAIVAVHLYGNPADLTPIKKIAKDNGIYLIEDCAQAAGSTYKNKFVGSFGDVACFSFYPTKNLGAYGDGGAIVTNNKNIYKNALLWRMYGEEERYKSILVGFNSRLDEIQAAILRIKLKYLKKGNHKRRLLAAKYKLKLQNLPLDIVQENPKGKSNYHLFVISTSERKKLASFLKERGIPSVVHYPTPIHMTPSFRGLGFRKGSMPISEKASLKTLSLPIYPSMSLADLDYITSSIKAFFPTKL